MGYTSAASATRILTGGPLHSRKGGTNAAKNYRNDGYRSTAFSTDGKGGDYGPRGQRYLCSEGRFKLTTNASPSVPFARGGEGGLPRHPQLRGAQVSRTFYARGRPDRVAARRYQALARQSASESNVDHAQTPRDCWISMVDGQARGIVTRDMVTRESGRGPRRCALCTVERQRFLPFDQRKGFAIPLAILAGPSAGAPLWATRTPDHPTLIR